MELELRQRIISGVVPALARGFLADRTSRTNGKESPDQEELEVIWRGTLTLLLRILTLLYADSRSMLVENAILHGRKSIRKIADEIANSAGKSVAEIEDNIAESYSRNDYSLYAQLSAMFAVTYGGDCPKDNSDAPLNSSADFSCDETMDHAVSVLLRNGRVPDYFLAVAIDQLARHPDPEMNGGLSEVRYDSLKVRQLGSIYETLLEYRLNIATEDLVEVEHKSKLVLKPLRAITSAKKLNKNRRIIRSGDIYLGVDKAERRATGVYFTPEIIVKYIVTHTVGPVLKRKLDVMLPGFVLAETMYVEELERNRSTETFAAESTYKKYEYLIDQLFDLKVLDPAMGSGHFLVEALHFITAELCQWLTLLPAFNLLRVMLDRKSEAIKNRAAAEGIQVQSEGLTDINLLKREVLERCIFGVDLDPLAAELAAASLWLEASATPVSIRAACCHLRIADSLTGDVDCSGYDCVIGNPPYLGHRGDFDAAPLRKRFRVCRDHANVAAAFVETSYLAAKSGGMIGLVVPKAIQYVDTWEPTRNLIAVENRLEHLIDVKESFDGVLLEQSIVIGTIGKLSGNYLAGVMHADGKVDQSVLPIAMLRQFKCLPAFIETQSLDLLAEILKITTPLGSISQTSQALGYQARLNRHVSGRKLPILRGKHIRPLRIEGSTDWIDEAFLTTRQDGGFTAKVKRMRQPKVVSQNIVAHITRPKPRIWIISAPDAEGLLCLNTVSMTLIHDARFDYRFISMILNSSLASWFYREFVFCRAVRTMHFDQYYAGKLPVICFEPRAEMELARLIEKSAGESSRARRQRIIDDFVFSAYRLEPKQRAFIVNYCYGVEGYAALERFRPLKRPLRRN